MPQPPEWLEWSPSWISGKKETHTWKNQRKDMDRHVFYELQEQTVQKHWCVWKLSWVFPLEPLQRPRRNPDQSLVTNECKANRNMESGSCAVADSLTLICSISTRSSILYDTYRITQRIKKTLWNHKTAWIWYCAPITYKQVFSSELKWTSVYMTATFVFKIHLKYILQKK